MQVLSVRPAPLLKRRKERLELTYIEHQDRVNSGFFLIMSQLQLAPYSASLKVKYTKASEIPQLQETVAWNRELRATIVWGGTKVDKHDGKYCC